MRWYVYILFCDSKSYYVGLTRNLDSRFKSHSHKENIATKEFNKIKLVYKEEYPLRTLAER